MDYDEDCDSRCLLSYQAVHRHHRDPPTWRRLSESAMRWRRSFKCWRTTLCKKSAVRSLLALLLLQLLGPSLSLPQCPEANWGSVALGASLAQLAVETPLYLDRAFLDQIRNLGKRIKEMKAYYPEQAQILATSSRIGALKLDQVEERFRALLERTAGQEAVRPGDHFRAKTRSKRGLYTMAKVAGGVATIGIGLYSALSEWKATKQVSHALDEAARLDGQVRELHHSLNATYLQLQKDLANSKSTWLQVGSIISFTMTYNELVHHVEHEMTQLEQLVLRAMDKKFNPLKYSMKEEKRLVSILEQKLAMQDLKLVDPEHVFHYETDVYFSNNSLFFLFHIPVMPTELNVMCLHRYTVHPYLYEEEGLIAELVPRTDFLAMDPAGRYHAEMSITDLYGCHKDGPVRICGKSVVMNGASGCLSALAYRDFDKAALHCQRVFHTRDPYVYQVNGTTFGVYSTETVSQRVSCPNDTSLHTLQGFHVVKVPPGCALHVGQIWAYSTQQIDMAVQAPITRHVFQEVFADLNVTERRVRQLLDKGGVQTITQPLQWAKPVTQDQKRGLWRTVEVWVQRVTISLCMGFLLWFGTISARHFWHQRKIKSPRSRRLFARYHKSTNADDSDNVVLDEMEERCSDR